MYMHICMDICVCVYIHVMCVYRETETERENIIFTSENQFLTPTLLINAQTLVLPIFNIPILTSHI